MFVSFEKSSHQYNIYHLNAWSEMKFTKVDQAQII